MKKIAIGFAVLVVLIASALTVFAYQAPHMLRTALAGALGKKVVIRSILFKLPGTFMLDGFEIQEESPFEGETCFYVDRLVLQVSPFSLFKKVLLVDKLDVQGATIIIRKRGHRLYHALSNTAKKTTAASPSSKEPSKGGTGAPLETRSFSFSDCHFKFIDYDVQSEGFVIGLEQIDGEIQRIRFPVQGKTSYRLKAFLSQGRDERPAALSIEGRTDFRSLDTDAGAIVENLFLPYFRPYYGQVTQAAIERGYLDSKIRLDIVSRKIKLNADLAVTELLFQDYESGNELFGLRADDMLSFLKDSSGRLRFQLQAEWDLNDRNVRPKEVLRRSIERSLKGTVFGNVGNLLQKTIEKIGEQGTEKTKNELQDTLKKVTEIFR